MTLLASLRIHGGPLAPELHLSFRRARSALFGLMVGLVSTGLAAEANWTQWRGPHANGTAPGAEPPTSWDGASGKNIRWRTELVGKGSATPIVWGEQIFIASAEQTERKAKPEEIPNPLDRPPPRPGYERQTTEPTDFYRFLVSSYQRGTGKLLWRKVVAELVPHEGHHATHSYAAGSPTTDGERLYVSFGSFGVYCFALDGKLLWERQLGRLNTRRGYGEAVTPVLHHGRLLLNWDQEVDSALYCIDAKTGETKWKAVRDEITTWTTPLVTEFNGGAQVILNGTRRIRSHDYETGRVIWSCSGMTENAIPSAIRYQDAAIILSGYRGNSGVSVPLSSQGDLGLDGPVNWRTKTGNPYVPSPVLVGDHLYFTKHMENVLTVRDAATGAAIIDGERIPGLSQIYSSPVHAGGRIYFTDRKGTTVVLRPGAKIEVLATNVLGDGVDASLVPVGRQLLVRAQKALYCIETRE